MVRARKTFSRSGTRRPFFDKEWKPFAELQYVHTSRADSPRDHRAFGDKDFALPLWRLWLENSEFEEPDSHSAHRFGRILVYPRRPDGVTRIAMESLW